MGFRGVKVVGGHEEKKNSNLDRLHSKNLCTKPKKIKREKWEKNWGNCITVDSLHGHTAF